jgi:hypothetical protein
MFQLRTWQSETCPQRQVYECKSVSVRGNMFENYLAASTKISPVAGASGSRLHNLRPFYMLLTEFRQYMAGLKVAFLQSSEQKMKNIQGLCTGWSSVWGSLETSLGSHQWSVSLRLNCISRRNRVTPRKLSSDICNLIQGFVSYCGNHHDVPSVASWFLNYDRSNYY